MESKDALIELKTLVIDAKRNLYRRIELAEIVLADVDWIAQVHGGSDLKAQDALQSEFFFDLGEYVTLGKLLAMYRSIPREQWEECRYNVAAVEVLYDGQADTEQREMGKRTAWKPLAEQRGEELEAAKARIASLEKEVEELRSANGRLHGRIEQLELMLEKESLVPA